MSDIKKMYQTDIIQAGEEIGFSRKKTVPLCAGTDCNSVMCVCVWGGIIILMSTLIPLLKQQ